MFTVLYKIVAGWLMPPGCFILLAAWGAWKARAVADPALRRRLRGLALAVAAGLYLLSIQPVFLLLAGGLEKRYHPPGEAQVRGSNAVIVLSAGIVEGAPASFASIPAVPGPGAVLRLSEGARLYRKIKSLERSCVVILTGGRFFGERHAASIVSREWLASLGIPAADILVETESRTTFEEARFAAPIVKGTGAEALFLVTHASHMPRAVSSFRKFGMEVIPAPAAFSGSGKLNFFGFLPSAGTLQDNRQLLWEYLGSVFYRLKRPAALE